MPWPVFQAEMDANPFTGHDLREIETAHFSVVALHRLQDPDGFGGASSDGRMASPG
jgi:hypothetical protein